MRNYPARTLRSTQLSRILLLLTFWLALPTLTFAQPTTAITIPGGTIYQTALTQGITYLEAPAGVAIINQKDALNIKSILLSGASEGTIGAVGLGVTKVISLSNPWLVGLTLAHVIYEYEVQPILKAAAPSGLLNLAPILTVTTPMTAIPSTCANNTIFASAIQGVSSTAFKAMVKKKVASTNIPTVPKVNIGGLDVTYVPQGAAVLKNASGSAISDFIVVDVLACYPQPASSSLSPVLVPPAAPPIRGATRSYIPPVVENTPVIAPVTDPPSWIIPLDAPVAITQLQTAPPLTTFSFKEVAYQPETRLIPSSTPDSTPAPGTYLQLAALSQPSALALRARLDAYGFETTLDPIPSGARVLVHPAQTLLALRHALNDFGFNGDGAIVKVIQ